MQKTLGSHVLVIQLTNMPLVQKVTDGMYRGVTTQDPTNRVEGQVEESINVIHSVEKGISRRNPTEILASIPDLPADFFTHGYERGDGLEEYIIVIADRTIRVFDTLGVERLVNVHYHAQNYLDLVDSTTAQQAFRVITVGDTSFILNREVVPLMSEITDGLSNTYLKRPFYWAKRSYDNGSGVGYTYHLQGATTNPASTTQACTNLAGVMGADYNAFGSLVVYTGLTPPSVWVGGDSFGDQASETVLGVVRKVSDLPRNMHGTEFLGYLIKVEGDAEGGDVPYWVEFKDGVWKETRAGGLPNTILPQTMPIKLVSLADGTFDATSIDWDLRKVGDETTAPVPSFIGEPIQDLFFFKNRLCLTAGENVVMSKVGKYFDFFPTTITDVLDSDPIDVAVDSNEVAFLNHAVPFNNTVVLLSTGGQFSLQSQKVLSPNDVSIAGTTAYSADKNVRPISLGSSLYFISKTLNGTALKEYFVDTSGQANTAIDVSAHVSGYIPDSISEMSGNTNQDIIMLLPHGADGELFVYKYYSDGESRIQTAWSKWVFGGEIHSITLLGNYLYIFIDRGTGIQLERLSYSPDDGVTSYLDNGTINYESSVTLSQSVLKDGNGKNILSAGMPLMLKSLQLRSAEDSLYELSITDKIRTRLATGFAVQDKKVLLQGKTREVSIKVQSVLDSPMEFHTYTTELLYNTRARNY